MSQFIGTLQRFIANVGPWFIQGATLGGLREALAATFDSAVTSLGAGMQLSQPLRCDESALSVLAYDRKIPIQSTESAAAQRARLAQWLLLHKQRGTHQGELRHVQPYFLPDLPTMHIVHQTGDGLAAVWHTLDPEGSYSTEIVTPSNWDFDGRPTLWSRFWLIITPPSGGWDWISPVSYDHSGTNWNAPDTYYNGIKTQAALDVVSLARGWKSAHSRLAGVLVNGDSYRIAPQSTTLTVGHWTSFPVAGNWKSSVDGSGRRARNPHVTFLYEDNP